jgi:hypothetical protein
MFARGAQCAPGNMIATSRFSRAGENIYASAITVAEKKRGDPKVSAFY